MTPDIILTLSILLVAVFLFVTERLRVDLVALLVLGALVLTGLVTPAEALSGFSNPAVVTVWAVFILSAGLAATGVANIIGRQVMRVAGEGEVRLIIVIMITAAGLSAFMNNIGVAALLLPVVLTIARQTGIRPSRLLMPLAYACLLGGMITLIGTPPNILASDAMRDAGFGPFSMFDFAPVGLTALAAGIIFVIVIGRRLLPNRDPIQALAGREHEEVDEWDLYELDQHLAQIEIPADSSLDGRTLAESRIGRVLGLTVVGVQRNGRTMRAIQPDMPLAAGDQLLALGRLTRLEELSRKPLLAIEAGEARERLLSVLSLGLAELSVSEESALSGQTVAQAGVRQQYGLNILAVRRKGRIYRTHLQELALQSGDHLLLQGDAARLATVAAAPGFAGHLTHLEVEGAVATYELQARVILVRIPDESWLAGRTVVDSHLGEQFDLTVLAIIREGETVPVPEPELVLAAGDVLLVEGRPEDLAIVRGLQGLDVRRQKEIEHTDLETAAIGLREVILAPRASVVGKTLREIHFRQKYGLNIIAIWRNGRAYRTGLGEMTLQFGDAFLVYGPYEQIKLLSADPDFIVLDEELQTVERPERAPVAVLIMAAVVITVIAGWLPIAIAAIIGSALMILSGCLSMEDAYRNIEWRSVFLIACMLPLGIAMETSGTAQFLAETVVDRTANYGTFALLAGLFLLATVASQVMPNAAVIVLMAPVALSTAAGLNLSPEALMMTIAVASSAAFMSPVGHPANGLVMGPGGYRFADYVRVGIPLTLIVMLVALVVLPIVWPL